MTEYKIIASDLDGTLLDDQRNISAENLRAIEKLSGKGIFFVPCSGRTFSEIPSELKNNPAIRYYIYSNGATVFDSKTGERVLRCIPHKDATKIFDVLYSFKTHLTFRTGGECYVDKTQQTKEVWDFHKVSEAHRSVIVDFSILLDDFKEQAYSCDNLEVIVAFFHSVDDKTKCMSLLSEIPAIEVVELDEFNVEIVNSTAGKGNALVSLAKMVGVDISQTIGVGDSGNDISAIKTAGLGLAMSNACDALKSQADEIICSNREHVAEYILNKYYV